MSAPIELITFVDVYFCLSCVPVLSVSFGTAGIRWMKSEE